LIAGIELEGDDEVRMHRGAHGLDSLDQQAHPPCDRSSVGIGPAIEQWRQELAQKETMRGVDLDAAEAESLCPLRRFREAGREYLDIVERHLGALELGQVERTRSRGCADWRVGQGTGMAELQP